ncbi:MAG TPA: hypothetical protein PLW65_33870 [Pseudomonadota bacterium]|nr:hypothetical protein [Pseudomonadota bacterium]
MSEHQAGTSEGVTAPEVQDDSLQGTAPAPGAASEVQSKAGKCSRCGHHAVRPTAQPGRVCRYRNTALTLPADLLVPTCRRCKHLFLSFDSSPELADALEATYRAELIQRAGAEITRLGRRLSQRKLEVAIDLSQGYLSRLCAGVGVPSATLVSLLALLSAEPARLDELANYWALPRAPEPRARRRRQGP